MEQKAEIWKFLQGLAEGLGKYLLSNEVNIYFQILENLTFLGLSQFAGEPVAYVVVLAI